MKRFATSATVFIHFCVKQNDETRSSRTTIPPSTPSIHHLLKCLNTNRHIQSIDGATTHSPTHSMRQPDPVQTRRQYPELTRIGWRMMGAELGAIGEATDGTHSPGWQSGQRQPSQGHCSPIRANAERFEAIVRTGAGSTRRNGEARTPKAMTKTMSILHATDRTIRKSRIVAGLSRPSHHANVRLNAHQLPALARFAVFVGQVSTDGKWQRLFCDDATRPVVARAIRPVSFCRLCLLA